MNRQAVWLNDAEAKMLARVADNQGLNKAQMVRMAMLKFCWDNGEDFQRFLIASNYLATPPPTQ